MWKVSITELRVLKYFLAVAKHENISRAAEELNLTQPTLSRQIAELEEELGTALLIRGKRRTQLTEAGLLLKARAEEIISLADKTVNQIANIEDVIEGDVYIGCGETEGMRYVFQAIKDMRALYPQIRIHLTSGNEELVTDGLQKGIFDFGLLCSARDPVEYSYLQIPHQ
ncbi:MAG: LysR family transcriptional regulator, partial [Selenomonadaceae bacterium]|nr:LysR family transcriptional regulator [Selenomonadaceae bacterium]